MFFSRLMGVVPLFFMMAVLGACGGGGSSSSEVKQTSPTVDKPSEPPPTVGKKPAADKPKCPRSIHPWENYMAVGDSITKGTGDDVVSDDVAGDGCYEGRGFPPVLMNKLESGRDRDYVVFNQGVGGATSGDGVKSIGGLLGGESMHYLILYGTNDSNGAAAKTYVTVKQFKQNMQRIIHRIHDAGKKAYLAKIPPTLGETTYGPKYENLHTGPRNDVIRLYNNAIDELVRENGITVSPPDLYNYFIDRPYLYADNVHPNGDGYKSIAELWARKLRLL